MKIRLIGGPFHGTVLPDVPEKTPELFVPDTENPELYHTYKSSRSGLFLYDHALGRDPGQGGYFVPPAWL